MSTNDTAADKASATDCTDYTTKLLPQHVYLGRDTEGYRHHLDREANTVTRFADDGTVERRFDLGEKHLDTYLAWVADEVGWETRKQAANWDFFPEVRP